MTTATLEEPKKLMTLPNDQDASGRTLGEEEIAAVTACIRTGTLTSTKGEFVKTLEKKFAQLMGVKFAYACSSGSAAVHCAIAAINPEPGDEIITTSITDMGALTPILYQGAIPVFADVDPKTYNVTAETIAARINSRTRAIVVTHLFGNPCDMTAIMQLAKKHNLPVIEDTAQSFLATHKGQYAGTFGTVGAFSLQQGKHITTGEGGICVTNNPDIARRIFLFINKAWGYGDPNPDHYFLALNYRMTELQGAVAVAQLPKLEGVASRRSEMANRLTELLADLRGIETPLVRPDNHCTWWKYCLRVDKSVFPGGPVELAKLLKAAESHRLRATSRSRRSCAKFLPSRRLSAKAAGRSRWLGPKRCITTARNSPERSRRWMACSCCRGTSATPMSTWNTSPTACATRQPN